MKFKAGDKVKVLKSRSSPHYYIDRMIDGIFEVKEVLDTYDFQVKVWNADKSDYWYFDEEDLELVNPLVSEDINHALFEVEKFLLARFLETENQDYYKQATNLRAIRCKILLGK